MVRGNALDIQLVEAESKAAFKEHQGPDGQTYVEAEPGAEYFIALKKTGRTNTDLWVNFYVDGKNLKYHMNCTKGSVDWEPRFRGLWRVDNGIEMHQALKFIKQIRANKTDEKPGPLLGSISIKVYESFNTGETRAACLNFTSETGPGSVSVPEGDSVASKKILRSGRGATKTGTARRPKREDVRKRGVLIETITMHYCAAAGLVAAGVLPKPEDIWECHRMKYPAKNTSVGSDDDDSDSDDEPLEVWSVAKPAENQSVVSSATPAPKKKPGSQEEYYFQKAKKLRIENSEEIAQKRMKWKEKGMSQEEIDKLFPIDDPQPQSAEEKEVPLLEEIRSSGA